MPLNTHELRVSSTSLGTYLTCPRTYAYELANGEGKTANEAMSFGTLVHACIEYRLAHDGRWPTWDQVVSMKGNYDDPRQALIAFPKLWEEVEQFMAEVEPETYVGNGRFEIERNLEDFDLRACDGAILCGGYIDLWDPNTNTMWDWKTRSSLSYAPKTREDFLNNPQLVYYAAAVAQALDLDGLRVGHVNLIRPSKWKPKVSKVAVYSHYISRWYLDAAWHVLTEDILPKMLAVKRAVVPGDRDSAVAASERNPSACYKYGKNSCAHIRYCPAVNTGDNPMTSLFAALRGE